MLKRLLNFFQPQKPVTSRSVQITGVVLLRRGEIIAHQVIMPDSRRMMVPSIYLQIG